MAGMKVVISGKLQGQDLRLLEGIARSIVEQSSGPVNQVHFEGVYRQKQEDLQNNARNRPVGGNR